MINKTIIILLILIAVGIGVALYQFRFTQKEIDNPVDYIPKNAAIAVKINGIQPLFALLNENNFFGGSNKDYFSVGNMLSSLDSLGSENETALEIINEQSGWLSIFPDESESAYLFVLPLGTKYSESELEQVLVTFLANSGIDSYEYSSNITKKDNLNCFYLFKNGLLFLSNQSEKIHEALLSKSGNIALLSDSSFAKVYTTSGANAPATIYLNFEKKSEILQSIFKLQFVKKIERFLSPDGWIALDVNISNKNVLLQGFSISTPSRFIGSRLLRSDQAVEHNSFEIIPQNIAFLSIFSLSDAYGFSIAKNDLIKGNKKYKNQINVLRKEAGFDIDEKIAEIISTSAGFFLYNDKTGFEPYFFVKLKNNDAGFLFVKENVYKAETPEDSLIYGESKISNIPYIVAGELVEDYKFSWICSFNDFLIFAESEVALKNYLNELKRGKIITQDSTFRFASGELILSKTNLSNLIFPAKTLDYFSDWFKDSVFLNIKSKLKNTRSFLGFQISANDPMLYANAFYYCERSDTSPLNIEWQLETDTSIYFLQQVNLSGSHPNFLVQDHDDNIFLITNYGRVQWKKQIDGPILGKVYLIDFYKNKKLQFIFNTAKKLYLIDKNGNSVEDFPIQFKTNASNGIALADFDNDRNYRLYLAFENRNFLVLTKEGRKIEGWQFEKSDFPVYEPANCFSYKGKDYIAFFDSTQIYLLNRKGESRLKKKIAIKAGEHSQLFIEKKNLFFRMAMIDALSKVHFYYPDCKSDVQEIESVIENAQLFVSENNYVLADSSQLLIADSKFRIISKIKLEEPIFGKIQCSKNDKNTEIYSYAYRNRMQINLISATGEKIKASPIFGDYPFIFISLSNGSGSQLLSASGKQLIYYTLP